MIAVGTCKCFYTGGRGKSAMQRFLHEISLKFIIHVDIGVEGLGTEPNNTNERPQSFHLEKRAMVVPVGESELYTGMYVINKSNLSNVVLSRRCDVCYSR